MNNEELFGRYNAVYNDIFPLADDNTKFSFNSKALTDTNISLLLTFPAVLSIKLAEQSDNPKLLKNLQSLKQMSESHHNIKYDDKQLNFIIKRIKNQFFFMTNPKAITLDLEIVENLLFSMSQYILLLCFLTKHIKSQEKIIYLSLEEVIEIMNKYLYKNPVHRAFLYLNVCLLGLAEGIVQKKIHDFSTNIETSSPIRSLPIASNKFMMNQRISSNNELFAFIEYPENSDSNNGLGFGININYLEEIPFKIWMTEFDDDFNQPSDGTQIQYYGYLFEGENIKGKNLTKEISMCIFRTSQEIYDVFNIIYQEWDNFIKNPENTLARNYQGLQPWKDSITKSPDFVEELKNSFLLSKNDSQFYFTINSKKVLHINPTIKTVWKEIEAAFTKSYNKEILQNKTQEECDENDIIEKCKENIIEDIKELFQIDFYGSNKRLSKYSKKCQLTTEGYYIINLINAVLTDIDYIEPVIKHSENIKAGIINILNKHEDMKPIRDNIIKLIEEKADIQNIKKDIKKLSEKIAVYIENNNSPKAHQLIYKWNYIENIHKEIRKIFLQYIEQKLNSDDVTKALKQNISSENISKLKDAHSQIKQFVDEMKKIKLKIIDINKLHKLIKKLNLTYLDEQYIDISDFIKSIKLNNTPYDIKRTLTRKILPIILDKLDGNPNKLEGESILKIISVAK